MAKPLPPNLEAYIINQIESLFFDVSKFAAEIEQASALMLGNGMSKKNVQFVLGSQLKNGTGAFGPLKNSTKGKLVETINQSSRKGKEVHYSDKDLFMWVSVGGHKICLDCDGRAGKAMTYNEWEGEGLPGTGWSVCKGYCYCVLDPTGKVGKNINVSTKGVAAEKGAKARPKPKASALDKAASLQTIKRHTTASKLPPHLEKYGGPNAMQRIMKKAKLDIDTTIHFPGVSAETLGEIAKGIKETLGRYNLNINYIGKNVRGLTMRNAAAAAWRIAGNQYNAMSFNGRYLKDWKKIKASSAQRFAARKKIKIANAQRRLDMAKANRQYYSSEASWRKAIKDAEENLATWSSSRYSRYSASDDIYGTTIHESWHIVDYKLNPKELLRVDFQRQLRINNVERMEWYHVSEYGGSSIAELWAETGAALDQGIFVPEGIKKAFIKTIENAGYTYP